MRCVCGVSAGAGPHIRVARRSGSAEAAQKWARLQNFGTALGAMIETDGPARVPSGTPAGQPGASTPARPEKKDARPPAKRIEEMVLSERATVPLIKQVARRTTLRLRHDLCRT